MTTILLFSILLLSIAVMMFIGYEMKRTDKVAKLRRELIDKVFSFKDWEWRLEVYDSVSFEQMCKQFWRPVTVEEFYEDTSFIK